MKLAVLLISLLLSLLGAIGGKEPRSGSRPRRAAPYSSAIVPVPKLGRCSGDAYCRSCSSCNYCGHCAGGGGTCGVCAPVAAPVRRVSRVARPTYQRAGVRGGGAGRLSERGAKAAPVQLAEGLSYYVAAATLNLRAEPSVDAEVVRVLTRNDIVTLLAVTDGSWVQVRVTTDEGDVEGYVARAYLAAGESK